jgi:septal ring factor EnvC (AmiA/AmiB activator)
MTQTTDTDIRDILINLDKKLDVYIAQNTEQMKSLESQLTDFKRGTEAQFADLKKGTDTQLVDIKTQLRSQDNRLWSFVTALILALVGLLAKLAFFPQT